MAQNDKKQAEKDFARIEAIYQKGVVSRDQYDRYRTGMLNAQVGVDPVPRRPIEPISMRGSEV